ncbi:hypothetical protein [Mycobacterium sp. 29Ha]|uniref:hypothetical protein n=1 Tax=Mycobacterium sp. 29Ha TaxID=2939268 RepID=UPI002938FB06|nr:hypothetical protein [Mycobacterium sp. 29Ha]MDV3136756.1 hypothetical protein [Mycobacterium sp. 29Ha]
MTAAAYDSAAWRRRVIVADLSPVRKLVLLALETFADYRDGTNAHPGERVLADMCNLTTRAVRDALACGRDLGLIERTDVANPKRGKSDVYRMVTTGTTVPVEPPTTGTAVPVNNRHHRNGHDITTGTATTSPPEPPFLPPTQAPTQAPRGESPQPGTSPAAAAPDTNRPAPNPSANGKPATPQPDPFDDDRTGDRSGPFAEAAAATAAPPNPTALAELEPPTRCPTHASWQGRVPDCGACGDRRKAHDRWAAEYERCRAADRDTIQAEIDACTDCGPHGLTEPDDPEEPSRRCDQHRQMSDLAPALPTPTRQEARR